MKFLILTLLALSLNSFAADGPVAKVVKIKGNVTFNGKSLRLGDMIKSQGKLITVGKSFVQIAVAKWNNKITVGPRSEMELDLTKDAKKKYSFLKGRCRWRTDPSKKGKGRLYTNVSALAVRGTDYLVIVNNVWKETEIVVLSGAVEFEKLENKAEKMLVSKGQWGAIGGRFGTSIGKIIDLPAEAIAHFDKQLKFH
jgi:hypothetical protein